MKKEWKVAKLGDVCNIIGGGTPSKKNVAYYGGSIPWATVRDMKNDYISQTEFSITEEAVKASATNIIPKDSVIIASRVGLGKVSIIKNDTAINQDLRAIIPQKTDILTEYLFWWFKSISEHIIQNGKGATVHGVTLPFLKNLNIPLPNLKEQARIVSILDDAFAKIDKIKHNAELNVKNCQDIYLSHLKDLFNCSKWSIKSLPDIATNLDSKRIPITKNQRDEGNYPYYGASGVVDYVSEYIFDDNLLLISEDGANLLARATPIAFSVSGKIWVNNHAHVLKFESLITQKFVELFFAQKDIKEWVKGAAQPKLNQKDLNSIPIPLPSLLEQETIVNKFSLLIDRKDKLTSKYKKVIDHCNTIKNIILAKAFNGKL